MKTSMFQEPFLSLLEKDTISYDDWARIYAFVFEKSFQSVEAFEAPPEDLLLEILAFQVHALSPYRQKISQQIKRFCPRDLMNMADVFWHMWKREIYRYGQGVAWMIFLGQLSQRWLWGPEKSESFWMRDIDQSFRRYKQFLFSNV